MLSGLQELFSQMWNQVRQANLYAGRPQNAASRESLAVAQQALAMATESGDDRLLAEAWYMMAYVLNANEDYIESLPYYRRAIPALEQTGDYERAARIRLGFIMALSATGQCQEALAVGGEADRLFREQNNTAGLAKLSTNLGNVFMRLDEPERAALYHSEAADLFRRLGDERALAQAYHNLGNTLCFLDRFAESEQMYANCEGLASTLGLDDLWGQSLYNKAYLYFLSGRLSQAIAVYRDVRPVFLNSGSRRHAALCDLDEAEIYVQLRLPHDALLLAQAAAESFAKLDMPYEQAKAIAFAGVALTQKRQFGDAVTAFRTAQSIFEDAGNDFWTTLLNLYRAEVLFSIGRLWEAFSLAFEVDAKFNELGNSAQRLVSLVLLGRVSMELGRLDDAAFYAQTVRDLAGQTKTPLFLFACHALSAEIAEREGRPEQAMAFYEQAAREIELRHTHLHHDELGITFYKGKAEVFESLASLTLAFDGSEASARVFAWCEKAKSQMFVDALAPHLPSVRSRANEALLARVDRIRGELNSSYLRFKSEFLATPGLPKGKAVELKEDELVKTLTELSASDSEYVSLQRASSVPIEELQRLLPGDITVVEYFFAREEVLAFLVSRDSFEIARQVTATKRVQYLVGRLQHQLKKFALAPGYTGSPDDLMRQFYRELVEPVRPFIHTGRMVIVPHGILHRVPFHMFHDGEGYLADRFDISYAPSGSVLKYCLDRTPIPRSGGTVRFVGREVRKAALRDCGEANLIHLEVPISLRQDNPVLSGLDLADGMFCIPDVYATRLDTNILSLALLDACVEMTGDGGDLLALERAFLYAGSRCVLVELWRVKREPSDLFFETFSSEWAAGRSRRQAMRSALEKLRVEYPHPFYWAPFVLTGQP